MCGLESTKFMADAKEAFEYWSSNQEKSVDMTFEKWVMLLLKKPVYDLLGEKRIGEV